MKILSLLSEQPMKKQEIINASWLSDRKVTLALGELRKEGKVTLDGHVYYLKVADKEVVPPVGKRHYILSTLFGLVAVLTSIISVRNTAVYFASVYPFPFYLIYSLFLSLFMVSAFSASTAINTRKSLKVGLLLVWFLATAVSMTTSVIGIYNVQKNNFVTAEKQEIVLTNNDLSATLLLDQITSINNLIADKRKTLQRYQDILSFDYDTKEKRDIDMKGYNDVNWSAFSAEKFIAEQEAQKKELALQLSAMTKEQKVEEVSILEAPDAFQRVGGLFGIDGFWLEFIFMCLCAMIVDILSPVATSMTMYLWRKD